MGSTSGSHSRVPNLAALVSERRRADRSRIAIAVRQSIDGQHFLCQAGDISPSGIFIARVSETPIDPLPKRCTLQFSLPRSPVSIEATGDLVWQRCKSRYHLMAISFRRLAPSHRRMIEDYTQGAPFAPVQPSFTVPHAEAAGQMGVR